MNSPVATQSAAFHGNLVLTSVSLAEEYADLFVNQTPMTIPSVAW